MTADEKAEYQQFKPASEKFVEELSDDDKAWLKKVESYTDEEKEAEFNQMTPEDKRKFEDLDREVKDFTAAMTPEK